MGFALGARAGSPVSYKQEGSVDEFKVYSQQRFSAALFGGKEVERVILEDMKDTLYYYGKKGGGCGDDVIKVELVCRAAAKALGLTHGRGGVGVVAGCSWQAGDAYLWKNPNEIGYTPMQAPDASPICARASHQGLHYVTHTGPPLALNHYKCSGPGTEHSAPDPLACINLCEDCYAVTFYESGPPAGKCFLFPEASDCGELKSLPIPSYSGLALVHTYVNNHAQLERLLYWKSGAAPQVLPTTRTHKHTNTERQREREVGQLVGQLVGHGRST